MAIHPPEIKICNWPGINYDNTMLLSICKCAVGVAGQCICRPRHQSATIRYLVQYWSVPESPPPERNNVREIS